jgi:copper chaperone NosL
MMKITNTISILVLTFIYSCKVEPEEIDYGKDVCHYCSMTIVDHLHGSELVTAKGRVYKYDATECLINDLKRRSSDEVGILLVVDYSNPGKLISAESATFLICEEVPSPMGAFLSAFSSLEEAELVFEDKGGAIYNWQSVTKLVK